jgi:hypothetical protein
VPIDGSAFIRALRWAFGGLIIGVLATANWPATSHFLRAEWPIAGALVGTVVGLLAMVLWESGKQLRARLRVSSLTIKLPLGEMKVEAGEGERQLLWRFFVQLATEIATQQLASGRGVDTRSTEFAAWPVRAGANGAVRCAAAGDIATRGSHRAHLCAESPER